MATLTEKERAWAKGIACAIKEGRVSSGAVNLLDPHWRTVLWLYDQEDNNGDSH